MQRLCNFQTWRVVRLRQVEIDFLIFQSQDMLKLRLNFNLSPNMLMNVILVKKVCKPILWVWAIRNQSLWALLFLPMVHGSREIEAIPVITRLLHSLGSHVLWRTHVRGEINIFNLVLKNTFRFITLIWLWYYIFRFSIFNWFWKTAI